MGGGRKDKRGIAVDSGRNPDLLPTRLVDSPFQPLPLDTSQLQTLHTHDLNLREPLDSSSRTLSLLLKDKKWDHECQQSRRQHGTGRWGTQCVALRHA